MELVRAEHRMSLSFLSSCAGSSKPKQNGDRVHLQQYPEGLCFIASGQKAEPRGISDSSSSRETPQEITRVSLAPTSLEPGIWGCLWQQSRRHSWEKTEAKWELITTSMWSHGSSTGQGEQEAPSGKVHCTASTCALSVTQASHKKASFYHFIFLLASCSRASLDSNIDSFIKIWKYTHFVSWRLYQATC